MKKRNIKVNYIYNLSFQVLNVILPLITAPYISRVLGASNLGVYSYADSLTGFFLLFATLGILQYGSREIARNRDDSQKTSIVFWELVILKLITSIISLMAFIGYLLLCESKYMLIYTLLSINFISNALEIGWFYNGLENFKASSLRNSFVKLLGILMVFVFVKDESDLSLYVLCIVVPTLAGNVLLWIELKKHMILTPLSSLHPLRHLKNVLVFFIPAVSAQIYHTVDKLMLQWVLRDNYQNGIYSQGYKIIVVILAVLTSYNAVMFSRMSNLYANKDISSINSYFKKSVSFIEMLGLSMCMGLFSIAPRFVPVFFGDGYDDVILLLRVLSPVILLTGLSNMIANQCLIPAGLQSKTNMATVTGALINIVFNAFLIPSFGAVGASIATVISELAVLFIVCIYAKDIISILLKQSWNYILGSLILGLTVCAVDSVLAHSSNILIEVVYLGILIITGIVVYFGFLLVRKDSLVWSYAIVLALKLKQKYKK